MSKQGHARGSRIVRILAGLAVAAISTWAWLAQGPAVLYRASYDLLHLVQSEELPADFPVAIVYLDLGSHLRLNQDPARPWSRSLHAQLVRRLSQAGAAAVVFDILFEQPSADARVDLDFAEAMRAHGRVVLGAEWNLAGRGSPQGSSFDARSVSLPNPVLREGAGSGHWGFVFSRVDSDFEVREHFPGFLDRDLPSLAWAAAQSLGLALVTNGTGGADGTRGSAGRRWMHYYGLPLSVPHVSFVDALDPAAAPDAFFRDKVVFVGARPEAGAFAERRDELRSPFSAGARGVVFMPGVEVHATQFANLLRGDWLRRLPPRVEGLLFAAIGFVCGWGLLLLRPIPAVGAAMAGEVVVVAAAAFAFAKFRIWTPWLIVCAVQIPAAWLVSTAIQSLEWYRQKRRYEEQFIRAQRLEAIWALAGGMAHDLNSALAPVVMGLQRLRKRATDAEQEQLIDLMQDSARRGTEMVRQVLASARERDAAQSILSPAQLLRDVEQLLAFTFPRNISVSVLVPPDLWVIKGNATQLHQALLNLCINARDAMPNGGELTLAADNIHLTAAAAKTIPDAIPGDYLVLIVADTGPGIPADVLAHLFEPFASSKSPGSGTGLGLFTARHVIRSHAGFIHVKCEAGMGTSFEIYLPRSDSPAATST